MIPVRSGLRVVGSLLLLANLASGQTEPKPLPEPRSAAEIPSRPMLMEPVIQREIGLTSKQRQRIFEIESEVQQTHQGATNLDDGEDFDFNQMMGGLQELAQNRQVAISRLLSPAQKTRLFQIELQREGWPALGRPDVVARIKLNKPQVEQIQSIIGKMRQSQMQANFTMPETGTKVIKPRPNLNPSNGFLDTTGTLLPADGGPLNFTSEEFRVQSTKTSESVVRIERESGQEVAKILTADQRTSFDRLLGPDFDFRLLKPGAAKSAITPPASTKQDRTPKKR